MTDEELFTAALRIQTSADRLKYLDDACCDNPDQRARIAALLAALDDAGSFLNKPVAELPPLGVTAIPEATSSGPHSGDASAVCLDFLSPAADPNLLGQLGTYQVEEVIGRGGMGIVLRARDPKLNRVVAIKVLAPEFLANPVAVKRFLREAQAAAAVTHDHVVRIYAVDDTAKVPYLVMECIVGQSLQQKIERRGILDVREILRIGSQIASGLAAAHKQGLVHRDIKPANILLENGIERVKITDFGLARAVDDVGMTQSGQVTGTPQYMSPEQAMGEPVDHRSDLFSLGSVLYTMCTGRPAFRATSTVAVLRRVVDDTPRPIPEINSECPEWLVAIVDRLMAKRPQDRFQTASEVAAVLERWLAHLQRPQAVPAPPPVTALEKLPTVTADRRGIIRRAWDEWWSERDRWFAITVQSILVVLHLICMIMFLGMASRRDFQGPNTQFTYTMGVPSPWFKFDLNPGGKLGFNSGFYPFTWSVLIGLVGCALYYIVWRIEKARDPNTSGWNKPQVLLSLWAVMAVIGVGVGTAQGFWLIFDGRVAKNPAAITSSTAPSSVGMPTNTANATSAAAPSGAAEEPPKLAEESALKLLKRFDPTTDRATPAPWANQQTAVKVEGTMWRLENDTNQGNFNVLMGTLPEDIPDDGLIVCRALVKVEVPHETTGGELRLGNNEPATHGYQWPASKYSYTGNITQWKLLETRYPAQAFQEKNPPQILVYLTLNRNGVLWVRDLELLHLPATKSPPSDSSGRITSNGLLKPAATERLLKRFDPAKEEALAPGWAGKKSAVAVEKGVWRIENDTNQGNFDVLLATYLDPFPADGIIICRAKVKVKANDKLTWGSLLLNDRSPSMDGYDWPDSKYTFRGNIPEWTLQEVRYPAKVFAAINPPQIPIYIGLHANGVLWVKDLELLHLPQKLSEKPTVESDQKALQGEWIAVAAETGTQPLELNPSQPLRLKFDENRTQVYMPGKLPDSGTFEVHQDKTPHRIAVTRREGTNRFGVMEGIYELQGDHLRIALGEPEDKVTEFKSQQRSRILVADFVRRNADKAVALVTIHGQVLQRGPVHIDKEGDYEIGFPRPFSQPPKLTFPIEPYAGTTEFKLGAVSIASFKLQVSAFHADKLEKLYWQAEAPNSPKPPTFYFPPARVTPAQNPAKVDTAWKERMTDIARGWEMQFDVPPPMTAPFKEVEALRRQGDWAYFMGQPLAFDNSIGMKLRLIPPGEFEMGSTPEQVELVISKIKDLPDLHQRIRAEAPTHHEVIDRPYFIGCYEVTYDQFNRFVLDTNYKTEVEENGLGGVLWDNTAQQHVRKPEYNWRNRTYTRTGNEPVKWLSPKDMRAFCKWLSDREGRRYSLVGNVEWEFACRAGTTTLWSSGDNVDQAHEYGVYTGEPLAVGTKKENLFGLFDMLGNLLEVTEDNSGTLYERGGSSGLSPWLGRSATSGQPAAIDIGPTRDRGFRVMCEVVKEQTVAEPEPSSEASQPNPVYQELYGRLQIANHQAQKARRLYDAQQIPLIDVLTADAKVAGIELQIGIAAKTYRAYAFGVARNLILILQDKATIARKVIAAGTGGSDLLSEVETELGAARLQLAQLQAAAIEKLRKDVSGLQLNFDGLQIQVETFSEKTKQDFPDSAITKQELQESLVHLALLKASLELRLAAEEGRTDRAHEVIKERVRVLAEKLDFIRKSDAKPPEGPRRVADAQSAWNEARLQLAEFEGNHQAAIEPAEYLIKRADEKIATIRQQVDAKQVGAASLAKAERELQELKRRLEVVGSKPAAGSGRADVDAHQKQTSEAKSPAVLAELRKQVELTAEAKKVAQARFEAAQTTKVEVIAAEGDWLAARIRLAQADASPPDAVVKLARELVEVLTKKAEFVRAAIKAAIATPSELNAVEKELSEARLQLGELEPGTETPKRPE